MAFVRSTRSFALSQSIFSRSIGASLLYAIVALFSLLIPAHQVAMSQSLPGVLPFSINEYGVDVATGNVNIAFPLRSKNGKIPFWSKIVGTSTVMAPNGGWQPMIWVYQDPTTVLFSWQHSGLGAQQCTSGQSTYNADYLNGFSVTDSTGAIHLFSSRYFAGDGPANSACANSTGTVGPEQATDDSGYSMTISNGTLTVSDRNGNYWQGICNWQDGCLLYPTYYDPDGASISWASGGLTDSLGKTALSGVPNYNLQNVPTNFTSSVVSYNDSNGNTQQYSFSYITLNLASNFNCGTPGDFSNLKQSMLTSVKLPGTNSGSYTIQYEATPGKSGYSTGRVTGITLPSGGSISYSYSGGNEGLNCTYQTVPTMTVTVNDNNGNSGTYTYVSSLNTTPISGQLLAGVNFTVTKTDPAGNQTVYYFNGEYQTQVQYYQGSATGTPLKTVTTCYNGNLTNCATPSSTVTLPITQKNVYSSYGSSSSDLVQTTYDVYGNVTSETDMDFGNVGSNGQCASATGGVCKLTTITYGSWNGSSCTSLGKIAAVPCDVKVTNNNTSAVLSETRYTYNSAGHPTAVSKWVSGSTWVTTSNTYNSNGTLASTIDPNNNATQFGYAGSGGCNDLLVTSMTYPLSAVGSSSQTWDCNGGVVLTSTDVNSKTTTYTYDDPLWRRTSLADPDGGSVTTTYNTGSSFPWTISTGTLINSGTTHTVTTQYDGFARTTETETSDPSGDDSIDTKYDAEGHVATVSNPHRSTSSATDGTTTYHYDALDRLIKTTEQDGSVLQWCYNCSAHAGSVSAGLWVDFTDESGNDWQRTTDSLGRLTEVMEPNGSSKSPTLETDYSYDGLNNLLSVTQWGGPSGSPGSRMRSFAYDGLSRLIQSFNPETGWVCYGTTGSAPANGTNCTSGYDGNGNLLAKTDSRGKTLSWVYDSLNRVTNESSSDGSVWYAYTYDNTSGSPGGIGRLYGAFNANGTLIGSGFEYDSMGRVIGQAYQLPYPGTWQQAFNIQYDLAGDVTSFSYPDGREVTQTWDSAGHLSSVNYASYNGQTWNYPYLQSATYYPNGSPQTMTLGNGVLKTYSLNNRLQTTEIKAQTTANNVSQSFFDKVLSYSPIPSNNGNIQSINDALNSARNQSFTYDTLNRVTSFASSIPSVSQTYSYDPFGNMSEVSPGTLQSNLFFGTNNQVSSTGFGYDQAGNMTQQPFGAGIYQYYAYDAASRLNNVNNGAATYSIDALGNRVRKVVGSSWSEYFYFNGQPMAEQNTDGSWFDYIYANGQQIARAENEDVYIHTHGTTPGGKGAAFNIPGPSYTVKQGDQLEWMQYQSGGAYGGPNLQFNDGSQTNEVLADNSGQLVDVWHTEGQWQSRSANLSSYAGKSITAYQLVTDYTSPAGTWDMYYEAMAIVSTDGTVTPIYYRQQGTSWSASWNEGQTNLSAAEQVQSPSSNPQQNNTTYYIGDQVGSARMLTAMGGYPVSVDTFYPFGQETTTPADDNTMKFTGKERDAESDNDYFPARYYASSMGRWLSPDWDGPDDPVPYANLDNPQSLNLYAYLSNNPLSHVDPLGHYHCDPDTMSANANGDTVVTAGACHYDMSDFPSLAVAVGHHFVDQAVIKAQNAWDSLAGQFFRRWTTGPTKPGGVHSGFPKPARLSQQQIKNMVDAFNNKIGKTSMNQWTTEEINEFKEEVANAGGDTGTFLESIAAENPAARTAQQDTSDIMQAAQKAWQATQNAAGQIGPAIEEGVEDIEEECGGGGCIPPL